MTYQLTKRTEPNCFVHLVQKAFVESERVKKKKKKLRRFERGEKNANERSFPNAG